MNREIYALQLIDEETGEVLKDVTPITESISVIHGDEKLSEVLDLQRDKIQEQSKSNLVLVTTMQKLLREKIEELEIQLKSSKLNEFDILLAGDKRLVRKWGYDWTSKIGYLVFFKPTSPGTYIVDFKYIPVDIQSEFGEWVDLGHAIGADYYKEIYSQKVQGFSRVQLEMEFTQEMLDEGRNCLMRIGKGTVESDKNKAYLVDFQVYEKGMDSKYQPSVKFIQEELDFYKSQLEKLKLTQEVDLNLLLTL